MLQHATAVVAFTVLLCLSACSGKKDRGGGDTGQDADAPSDTTETTDPDVGEPDVPLDDPLDPDQPMDGREEPDAVETDVAEEDATEDPETEELTCVAPYPALSDVRVTISDSESSTDPCLAWTGSEFGVSWVDSRDGTFEIYFARISSAGSKIGTDERVTSYSSPSGNPTLTWTGSEFGVSWQNEDLDFEIYFARISASGSKVGTDLRVTSDAARSETPSLAWTGSEFGVSWVDSRDGNPEIYFARISSSGTKVGTDVRVTDDSTVSYNPSLAWTGSEFGVGWVDPWDAAWDEISFARISSSGSKVGTDVRVTNAPEPSWTPSLAWTGSEFGVSWQDDRDTPACFEIFFNLIRVCP